MYPESIAPKRANADATVLFNEAMAAIKVNKIDAALMAQREAERAGRRSRIGELLTQQGAISEEQLKIALRDQEQDFFSLFMD